MKGKSQQRVQIMPKEKKVKQVDRENKNFMNQHERLINNIWNIYIYMCICMYFWAKHCRWHHKTMSITCTNTCIQSKIRKRLPAIPCNHSTSTKSGASNIQIITTVFCPTAVGIAASFLFQSPANVARISSDSFKPLLTSTSTSRNAQPWVPPRGLH